MHERFYERGGGKAPAQPKGCFNIPVRRCNQPYGGSKAHALYCGDRANSYMHSIPFFSYCLPVWVDKTISAHGIIYNQAFPLSGRRYVTYCSSCIDVKFPNSPGFGKIRRIFAKVKVKPPHSLGFLESCRSKQSDAERFDVSGPIVSTRSNKMSRGKLRYWCGYPRGLSR